MSSFSFVVKSGGSFKGELVVPGDKSISHRAIMLGALAHGITEIEHFLMSEDALATLQAFRLMGVKIEKVEYEKVRIQGVGLQGLKTPEKAIDCGNSGTAMRLLAGILVGQPFNSVLIGDDSLMKRPMQRIIAPLIEMGAHIISNETGRAPLKIKGNRVLQGIHYKMPIASAQVKSCLLLAGLFAKGKTKVIEPVITRNHTENMLRHFGYKIVCKGNAVELEGGGRLSGTHIIVPGDISSAAFFMVGASIAKESDVLLKTVGVNPTRIGVVNILRMMGAYIQLKNERELSGEPVADIVVKSRALHGIDIPIDQVPLAIDEFPVLFIAAACAKGTTMLRHAKELRVKESDRIVVMAEGLKTLGIKTEVMEDGIQIEGGQLTGGKINSYGDHRVAMAFAIAGLRAKEEIIVEDCANVATSFPNFVELSKNVGLKINLVKGSL